MLPVSEAFSITRAIAHGWKGLKREPVGLLLGAFLLSIVEGGGGGGGGNNFGNLGGSGGSSNSGSDDWSGGSDWSGDSDWSNALDGFGAFDDPAILMVIGLVVSCVCILQLAFWLAASFIKPGYLQMHQEVLTDGVSSPGRLFGGKEQFKSMAMWKFLKGVIGLGTGMVAMAPGGAIAIVGAIQENGTLFVVGVILGLLIGLPAIVYVSLGLILGEHAVALEDMGPMDALERSWSLARGNRFSLLLFSFVTGLFGSLGLLACCIGVIGTKAMVDFGWTEAYLLATQEDWENWQFIQDEGLD